MRAKAAAHPRVTVVGSINQDLVVSVPHLPAAGETVAALGHTRFWGGKGANQAVAAARLGASVTLIGNVGGDDVGSEAMTVLASEGIDVAHVHRDASASTGLAVIQVAAGGANTIAVTAGANGSLTPQHVEASADSIAAADIVLVQLEIPPATVEAVVHLGGEKVVLNAAPARSNAGLAAGILVVNETELALLADRPVRSSQNHMVSDARTLGNAVIVTIGAKGALIVTESESRRVPAPTVEVVDTTAAGDAFCGAIAVRLGSGDSLLSAVRYAVAAGAAATTVPGAQASLPYPGDVEDLLA